MPSPTSPVTAGARTAQAAPPADPRRWRTLIIVAIAQLMIVVDASIVNIALPSAQRSLHISVANRQWVVTAYTLAFGGLLLLGGRIADYVGRKRVFVIGLVGFAVASALGGLAPDAGLLFGARALQGAFAALMAPAGLSLLQVSFTEPRERARAFGVYGAVAGGGLAIGLILGGVLAEYASWRWCLLVNTPIAAVTALAALRTIKESRVEGNTRYDIPGAVTVTAGLVALVYGMTKAETDGWSSSTTVSLIAAAVVLLAAFVAIEIRSSHPILPLRVVGERNRGGSFIISALSGAALFGISLFLTYYLQQTLHYSALKSGFAFMPFSIGVVVSAGAASSLLPRLGARWTMAIGTAMATAGMLLLTSIGLHTDYWTHVMVAELVMSLGLGLIFVPVSSTALVGIANHDAGVGSALVNTTQQVGGSIGVALLNTLAASATTSYVAAHGVASAAQGAVHGYVVAFVWGAALLAASFVAAVVFIRAGRDEVDATTDGAALLA